MANQELRVRVGQEFNPFKKLNCLLAEENMAYIGGSRDIYVVGSKMEIGRVRFGDVDGIHYNTTYCLLSDIESQADFYVMQPGIVGMLECSFDSPLKKGANIDKVHDLFLTVQHKNTFFVADNSNRNDSNRAYMGPIFYEFTPVLTGDQKQYDKGMIMIATGDFSFLKDKLKFRFDTSKTLPEYIAAARVLHRS